MTDEQPAEITQRPWWKRFLQFPLVAMVIAIVLLIVATIPAGAVHYVLPKLAGDPLLVVRSLLEFVFTLAMYKLVMVRLGRRPRDELKLSGAGRQLGRGLLLGVGLFSLVVAVAALLHVYAITGRGDTSALLSTAVGIAIMPAFREELLFRGVLFRWLEEFGGSWFALALTSALFGAAHLMNTNATTLSAVAIAIEAGVLLGAAYMLTRSLWMPMGFHAAWNFTQGEIFDVPVSGVDQHGLVTAKMMGDPLLSGGMFGLEASVIAMVLATATGLWLVYLAVRAGEVMPPMWIGSKKDVAA